MLDGAFIFDGRDCREFGIRLSSFPVISPPQPRYERYSIPSRNGELHLLDGSFANRTATIKGFIFCKEVAKIIPAVNEWLYGDGTYRRLELTSDPDAFYLAKVVDGLAQTEVRERTLAAFELTFDLMPQRFLHSGDITMTLDADALLRVNTTINGVGMPSRPLLQIMGGQPEVSGWLAINDTTITLTDFPAGGYIDCDEMEAYSGDTSANAAVSLVEFPVIKKGRNTVTGQGMMAIKITPRWWTL